MTFAAVSPFETQNVLQNNKKRNPAHHFLAVSDFFLESSLYFTDSDFWGSE